MDPFTIYLFLLYLLCVVGVVVMAVVVMVGGCSQFHYTSPSFLAETYMILPPPKKIVPSIIHPSLVFIRKLVYLCYCWPCRCCCFIPHSTYHIFDSVCFSSIFVYALYICTMRYVERIILSYIFDFRYGFFFSKWFDPYFLDVRPQPKRFLRVCVCAYPFVLIIMQVTKR